MKILLALFAVSVLASAPQPARAATAEARINEPLHCGGPQSAEYSLADGYRFKAVSASTSSVLPVAAASATPVPQSPWLLLASGLAAALWVARRRLDRSF